MDGKLKFREYDDSVTKTFCPTLPIMPTDAISSEDMMDVQDDDAVEFSAVNEEELEEEVGSDNVFEHMYDNIYREPLFGKPSELSPIETRKLLPRLSEKIGKDFFLCGELHRVTDVYVS